MASLRNKWNDVLQSLQGIFAYTSHLYQTIVIIKRRHDIIKDNFFNFPLSLIKV